MRKLINLRQKLNTSATIGVLMITLSFMVSCKDDPEGEPTPPSQITMTVQGCDSSIAENKGWIVYNN